MTPTQRSLKMLREDGWSCWIVEKWNPHARVRVDLFGVADILCVRGADTLAVQTTSGSNVSARVKKLDENEYLSKLRGAGWIIHIHGWRKVKVKRGGKATVWACRILDIS